MKLFLALLLAFTAAAQIPGTFRVTGPVAPPATNSNFGATDPVYGKGGLLTGLSSLSQLQDTNRYPLARRHAGMMAVTTNGIVYQLGSSLTNWSPANVTYPVEIFGVYPSPTNNIELYASQNVAGLRAAMSFIKAAGGGTLQFGAGYYCINDTITNLAYVNVQGLPAFYNDYTTKLGLTNQRSASIIYRANGVNKPMWVYEDTNTIARGTETLPDGSVTRSYWMHASMRDLSFAGNDSGQTVRNAHGIVINNSWSVTLSGVSLDAIKGDAIHLYNCNTIKIENCSVTTAYQACLSMYFCQDCEITGNWFGGSLGPCVWLKYAVGNQFYGNLFFNSYFVNNVRCTSSYDPNTLNFDIPVDYQTGDQLNVYVSITNTPAVTGTITGSANPYTLTLSSPLPANLVGLDSFYFDTNRYVVGEAISSLVYTVYGYSPSAITAQPFITVRNGTLPIQLSPNAIYYAIRLSSTNIQLATTLSNAYAGNPITLTTNANQITVDQGGSAGVGLYGNSYNNTFTANRMDQLAGPGVDIQNGIRNVFVGNLIYWNGWLVTNQVAGFQIRDSSSDNTVVGNVFSRLATVPQYANQYFGILSNGKNNHFSGNNFNTIPTPMALVRTSTSNPDYVLSADITSLRTRSVIIGPDALLDTDKAIQATLWPYGNATTATGAAFDTITKSNLTGNLYGTSFSTFAPSGTNAAMVGVLIERNVPSSPTNTTTSVGLMINSQVHTNGSAELYLSPVVAGTPIDLAGVAYSLYQAGGSQNYFRGPTQLFNNKIAIGVGAVLDDRWGVNLETTPVGGAGNNNALRILHNVANNPSGGPAAVDVTQRFSVTNTYGSGILVRSPNVTTAGAGRYSAITLAEISNGGFNSYISAGSAFALPPAQSAFIYSTVTNLSYFSGGLQMLNSNAPIFLADSKLYLETVFGPQLTRSAASPEGVVSGNLGSLALNSNGSAGTSAYVKSAGSGSTGWSAIMTASIATASSFPYAVTGAETIVLVAGSGARGITIPAANSATSVWRVITIKDSAGNAGSGTITITPVSGNIDGAATATITINYGAITVVSDGSNWFIIQDK